MKKVPVCLDELCATCRSRVSGKSPCYGCGKLFRLSQLDAELNNRCKSCAEAWQEWQLSMGNANVTTTMNSAVARSRAYRKQIERGVYGRDLIQPLDEHGEPNPDFVEHYGIANYTNEDREKIRDRMGNGTESERERDYRSAERGYAR